MKVLQLDAALDQRNVSMSVISSAGFEWWNVNDEPASAINLFFLPYAPIQSLMTC